MARVLSRSKSMRLRSSPKDLQPDTFESIPSPESFRTGQESIASPNKSRADSGVTMSRPRTSSGDARDKKPSHPKHVPIVINHHVEGFDFSQPSPNPSYSPMESSDHGAIGMALGSPTQAAPPSFPPRSTERLALSVGMTTPISPEIPEKEAPQPKPKVSRWKSIFGKKPVEQTPPQPFYQAQPTSSHRHHLGSEADVHAAFKTPSPALSPAVMSDVDDDRKRSRTGGRSVPGKKAPLAIDPSRAVPSLKSKESPQLPRKDASAFQVPKVTVSSDGGALSPSSPPLLDIDIPKIEMERYSVMFGSLLGSNRNSSLLVRRQGNADRLKPLDERSLNTNAAMRPQRRATSPTIKRSPLSLFPTDTRPSIDRSGTLNRPRPLLRSRTVTGATSPSRRSFDHSDDGLSEGPSTAGLSTAGLSTAGFPSAGTSDDGYQMSSASLNYAADRETMAVQALRNHNAWKPDLNEPAWEIVNKPMNSPQKASSPNQTSTLTIVAAPPSAHVGIARQVSVSRPNRTANLLQPTIASPERLVQHKPLTPTLVELKNRKSQRVQIVDA